MLQSCPQSVETAKQFQDFHLTASPADYEHSHSYFLLTNRKISRFNKHMTVIHLMCVIRRSQGNKFSSRLWVPLMEVLQFVPLQTIKMTQLIKIIHNYEFLLLQIKFSHLSRNMTMQRTVKLYKLPETPKTPGFRALTEKDLPLAHKLLAEYLLQFSLIPVFTEEEFRHWFSPQNGIICSYVVEDKEGKITDLVSYYTLPSTVMHHAVHKTVKAAYSFYNVSTKTDWIDLMNDALISAKNSNFDVFNALDLMDNIRFLEKLKFGIGDGNLQYYLYNWRCPNMTPEEVGLILLQFYKTTEYTFFYFSFMDIHTEYNKEKYMHA